MLGEQTKMSLPLGRLNGSLAILDNVSEVGLAGFTGVIANSAAATGADFAVAGKCTLLILGKLSAGSATIAVDNFVPGAAHTFGSPAASQALSGTNPFYIAFDVPAATLGLAVLITAGGSGCTFSELVVAVVFEKAQGEGWLDDGSAQNAELSGVVLDTVGSSSTGLFDRDASLKRGPAVSHIFGT